MVAAIIVPIFKTGNPNSEVSRVTLVHTMQLFKWLSWDLEPGFRVSEVLAWCHELPESHDLSHLQCIFWFLHFSFVRSFVHSFMPSTAT